MDWAHLFFSAPPVPTATATPKMTAASLISQYETDLFYWMVRSILFVILVQHLLTVSLPYLVARFIAWVASHFPTPDTAVEAAGEMLAESATTLANGAIDLAAQAIDAADEALDKVRETRSKAQAKSVAAEAGLGGLAASVAAGGAVV